jgi:hypothetical protein
LRRAYEFNFEGEVERLTALLRQVHEGTPARTVSERK